MNNPFINIDVSVDRFYFADATSDMCKSRMYECLTKSIDELCKSPHIDRERIMSSQYDIIVNALLSYLRGTTAYILEAPTGVGKSIIGILISATIEKYMNYHSCSTYVLTSSKMLQDQLDKDKDFFNIDWAILKGQANYECKDNGKLFPERTCKDLSIPKAIDTKECACSCKYMQDRLRAQNASAAVFSYAYWLTTMNFVYEYIGEYAPFHKRHVTIFDECHMLSDIVQSMFQNSISDRIIRNFTLLHDTLLGCNIDNAIINYSLNKIEVLKENINNLLDKKISTNDMFNRLVEYYNNVYEYSSVMIKTTNKYLPKDPKIWIVEQRKFDLSVEQLVNYRMNLGYFINENKNDIGMIVKTYQTDSIGNTTMLLRSLREQDMIKQHVHKYCDFQVFMSATIGDADVFAKNIGLDNYETYYIESNFKYENSPIYHVTPPISMAMKHKAANMKELMWRMLKLCDKHSNERGLIHTGNFEIARAFKEFIWEHADSPRRFIFYTNASEKQHAIQKLQKNGNGVIIGPSLTEGLDLKDDLCRFMILAKVPYPMLDEYNSMKMKIMPDWYGWKTLTSIIQSLGRGIRHRNDYCTTYLIDSCFDMVFSRQRVPKYITTRFDKYQIGNIVQNILDAEAENLGLFNNTGVIVVKQPKSNIDSIDVNELINTTTNITFNKPDGSKFQSDDDLPF